MHALQGVWGTALPRQLHGLLGPSGAGKSTLLDLLTLRLQNGNCTGQLLINKQPVAQQQLASIRVYVPQRDSLVPVMTARESVEFAAALKLPKGTPKAVLQERVGHVLQLMGLDEQQDMLVSWANNICSCICAVPPDSWHKLLDARFSFVSSIQLHLHMTHLCCTRSSCVLFLSVPHRHGQEHRQTPKWAVNLLFKHNYA